MKKLGKFILIIIMVIILLAILAIGAVMIFKPELARAVYDGLMLDSEQIEEKKKENDKQLANTINDFGLNVSEEDVEKLGSGELSEEEIKDILLGTNKEDTPEKIPESEDPDPDKTEQDKPAENEPSVNEQEKKPEVLQKPENEKPPVEEKAPEKKPEKVPEKTEEKVPEQKDPVSTETENKDDKSREYEEKTAELIAKMYSLKSQFIGQINGVVASMKAEYAALPKEQQNMSSKTSIANRYLGQISSLEAQCDAQVNLIVTELRDVLTKSGQDTSLADAVLAAYNNEKETTKAAYINKYSD